MVKYKSFEWIEDFPVGNLLIHADHSDFSSKNMFRIECAKNVERSLLGYL